MSTCVSFELQVEEVALAGVVGDGVPGELEGMGAGAH